LPAGAISSATERNSGMPGSAHYRERKHFDDGWVEVARSTSRFQISAVGNLHAITRQDPKSGEGVFWETWRRFWGKESANMTDICKLARMRREESQSAPTSHFSRAARHPAPGRRRVGAMGGAARGNIFVRRPSPGRVAAAVIR
jgi:hypothetical protein